MFSECCLILRIGSRILKPRKDSVVQVIRPELVERFENFLWAETQKDWMIKTTLYQDIIYITILTYDIKKHTTKKVRRTITMKTLKERESDLHGLASDVMDEVNVSTRKKKQ